LKLPPVDDAAGDFHERFVDEGEAHESNAQAPEVMRPGDCAFDDPSGFAEATAVRLSPTGIWVRIPAACRGQQYLS
jgi:hypothetical protein